MVSESDIKKMANIIAERFSPERIILFGSYVHGSVTDDSDVDLLIIRKTDEDFYERHVPIRLALREFGCPLDILVLTPEEFEEEQSVYWTVVADAAEHGRIIYDKAA